MRKMLISMLLLLCLMSMMVGCGADDVAAEEAVPSEEVIDEPVEEVPSVGLVMVGSINDMDWNAAGYDGLMQIEEQYGADVSYAESIPQSELEEVMRNYAEAGYDIVFGHSAQCMDSILAVAEFYPETQFVCVNGYEVRDNVANIEIAEYESGYMMGAAAAMLSESNTVGVIGSVDIKPVRMAVDAYALGAKSINSDIEVLSTMTGSWSDANKAKEIAYSMIDNDADVIANLAGIAGISIIEAASENDILAIGAGTDQHVKAPENVPVSIIMDLARLFTFIYEQEMDGTLEQTSYFLGTKDGAVYPIYPEDNASQEIKDTLAKISEGISNGDIVTRP
jgi:basic membrane protein A